MCAFGDGLDAVVFFWVVRGRYVSCAIEVEIRTAGCEINCWGRGKADVGCFHAAFGDAFDEGFLEGWAGEANITADGHVAAGILAYEVCCRAFADEVDGFFGEVDGGVWSRIGGPLFICRRLAVARLWHRIGFAFLCLLCDASNVVCAEDVWIYFCHGWILTYRELQKQLTAPRLPLGPFNGII